MRPLNMPHHYPAQPEPSMTQVNLARIIAIFCSKFDYGQNQPGYGRTHSDGKCAGRRATSAKVCTGPSHAGGVGSARADGRRSDRRQCGHAPSISSRSSRSLPVSSDPAAWWMKRPGLRSAGWLQGLINHGGADRKGSTGPGERRSYADFLVGRTTCVTPRRAFLMKRSSVAITSAPRQSE
jgi:hypothetical protein